MSGHGIAFAAAGAKRGLDKHGHTDNLAFAPCERITNSSGAAAGEHGGAAPFNPVGAHKSGEIGEELLRAVEADPALVFEIDVASRTLRAGDVELEFPLDDSTQHRFLEGLDDIALTLKLEDEIAAFEAERPTHLPTVAR